MYFFLSVFPIFPRLTILISLIIRNNVILTCHIFSRILHISKGALKQKVQKLISCAPHGSQVTYQFIS